MKGYSVTVYLHPNSILSYHKPSVGCLGGKELSAEDTCTPHRKQLTSCSTYWILAPVFEIPFSVLVHNSLFFAPPGHEFPFHASVEHVHTCTIHRHIDALRTQSHPGRPALLSFSRRWKWSPETVSKERSWDLLSWQTTWPSHTISRTWWQPQALQVENKQRLLGAYCVLSILRETATYRDSSHRCRKALSPAVRVRWSHVPSATWPLCFTEELLIVKRTGKNHIQKSLLKCKTSQLFLLCSDKEHHRPLQQETQDEEEASGDNIHFISFSSTLWALWWQRKTVAPDSQELSECEMARYKYHGRYTEAGAVK